MFRITLLSLPLSLLLSATQGSAATIVSHWSFDDVGDTTPDDSAGGRDLTLVGSTAYTTSNKPSFAGPGTNVAALDLTAGGNGARYDVTGGDSLIAPYSVSLWANINTGTGSGTFIGTRSPTDTSFDAKFQGDTLIHGDIGTGGGWLDTSADATFDYQADTWHHIVYNVDATGFEIWADGNLLATDTLAGTALFFDATHDIGIGGRDAGLGENFPGLVDEVYLFDGTLTPEEIRNLFVRNQLVVPEPAALAIWMLLGGAGAGFAWRFRRRRV